MAKKTTDINVDGIEELVNSSLDITVENSEESVETVTEEDIDTLGGGSLVAAANRSDASVALDEMIEQESEDIEDEAGEVDANVELSSSDDNNLDESIETEPSELDPVISEEVTAESIDQDALQTDTDESQESNLSSSTQEEGQVDSIEILENEVSELEAEIQIQMDNLAVKADHLKVNIQSELQRVAKNNEELQQQVSKLDQQLSSAEEKVDELTQVQNRQQITIKKLISILRNVNLKIADLYDEK